MNSRKLVNSAFLLISLLTITACSSTSEDTGADQSQASSDSGLSGIEATTQRTNQLEAEARARAAAAEERIRSAALSTRVFYFDFDVAEFRPADRDVLRFHAQDLASNPSKRIRLEGHADERGTREYNLALGERRANGIQNYFIVNGASRNQVEVVSYGEERPANTGTTEQAYQLNRRVEIIER